ncbi:MAG: DNA polymerase I [Acholeplasmatales bacterium]|nr:DNA polymerase I [Acholeplasmatales bacterium]
MKRLILVDGNSLMYRAYYGYGDPTKMKPNSKGIYTNAVNAFIRMVHNLLDSQYDKCLIAFDAGKHTFRHNIQPDYKAGRAHMPDEMRMQIAYLKEFLTLSHISQFEIAEYEADDIIGTMSKRGEEEGYHVDVYSSDKDLLQLVSDNTTVHMTKKGMSELEDFTKEHFREVYEIEPTQFIDLKALMGDKSDNISGIPGIGPKKGIKLLQTYGSVEGIIEHIEDIKGSDHDKFKDNVELLKRCKTMVTILRDAPLGIDLEYASKGEADNEKLKALYEELELNGILKELNAKMNALKPVYNDISYKIIDNIIDIKSILLPHSSIIYETLNSNYHNEEILAIGLRNKLGTFIIKPELIDMSLDLQLFLSDNENAKDIFDYKKSYVLTKKHGYALKGIDFDLLLAAYVINPSTASHEFKAVASSFEYYDVSFDEEIYGKGVKKAIPSDEALYTHIAKKVNCIYLIKNKVKELVKEQGVDKLLYDVEIPLSKALGDMEFEGVTVDLNELETQKKDLSSRINFIESEIYRLCGETFNIASPKQLGEVLFEHMNLPFAKKTKTGYSTNQEILEKLRGYHEVIDYILTYRQLTKLYQTYIVGLESQVHSDSRVHTIYEQALTETGRLSSIEPNLQNIPARSEEGRNIRKMFKPNYENYSFLSCDYSQIELRVLAAVANVKTLIESFNNGEDIHSRTAREIFGIEGEVDDLHRRQAKAVNFGIIYGLSAYGLGQEIGMSNKEASNFIKRYYELYPEIKTYMDNTIKFAEENGYVTTILNRRRYIPDINSKNFMMREFGKRTAMNAPIQGSAADIIKVAMVNISKRLEKEHFKSKMVLQIHDELIFEVENSERDSLLNLVSEEMINAVKLPVKLDISKDFGPTWYEV